ncbi:MAG: peptide ABC transporter permease [Desulfobulbus propionicus]|nr:MAG: peptide ABC transporter permease [Desulfobulbus propionicus]
MEKELLKKNTPGRRRWRLFRQNKRGFYSLILFTIVFVLSLFAEVLSNDKPVLVNYQNQWYFPLWNSYPETVFGGDFETATDYRDPYIIEKLTTEGNTVIFPFNPHSYNSINLEIDGPVPSPPTRDNLLGTDDRGRDVLARLLYGFRLSVVFGLALTSIGTLLGILAGAVQGYFGGKIDLFFQRFIEIWGSMPELYLLIIFASIFKPSVALLLILLSLFGWMGLSDYVRAEFLKGRNMEYVKAARALGVDNITIMYRHLLPNGMTPVITFLPFRMSGAILALTSLDFLGLGVPPSTPSLGELLAQGKANIDAWWLSLSTFVVLVGTLILLIFIGEALREAFDPRKQ